MSTMLKNVTDFTLLAPHRKFLIRLIPFVLTWVMFGTVCFHAQHKGETQACADFGILAGTAHQAFQFLYISSQLWVSRYKRHLR